MVGSFIPLSVFELNDDIPELANHPIAYWANLLLYEMLSSENKQRALDVFSQFFPRLNMNETVQSQDQEKDQNQEQIQEQTKLIKILYEKLSVNSVSLTETKRAIYTIPSYINHSCVPNVIPIYGDDDILNIWSTRDIKEGEEIFQCYLRSTKDKESTQSELKKIYGFECQCERCSGKVDYEDWKRSLWNKCVLCGKETTMRCRGCKLTYYCSAAPGEKGCNVKDWKRHKETCNILKEYAEKLNNLE
jgi:hypothetical protein